MVLSGGFDVFFLYVVLVAGLYDAVRFMLIMSYTTHLTPTGGMGSLWCFGRPQPLHVSSWHLYAFLIPTKDEDILSETST